MHELNICLSLVRIVEEQCLGKTTELHHAPQIKTVWLEIGELAGIELDALRFSFPIAASHSIAKHATLNIASIQGKAWCDDCQKNVTIKTYLDPCPDCGSYHYSITQGKELRIIKMEVI